MEIGIGHCARNFCQWPLDADLAAQALPVKQQRGLHISANLAALAALRIGVKGETVRSVPFQKHHTHRWRAIWRRCGKRHGVGIIEFRCFRLIEPRLEQTERVSLRDLTIFKLAHSWRT